MRTYSYSFDFPEDEDAACNAGGLGPSIIFPPIFGFQLFFRADISPQQNGGNL